MDVLNEEQGRLLLMPFPHVMVKKALFFFIPGAQSPGPYGYRCHFLKDAWDNIIKSSVDVVLDCY